MTKQTEWNIFVYNTFFVCEKNTHICVVTYTLLELFSSPKITVLNAD